MYFDTHAHYYDEQFDDDRDELLSSMPENGVELIVCPGDTEETSRQCVELAEKYPFIYAAVGIHPENALEMDGGSIERLRAMAAHPKVKAIGEIGLDHYWKETPEDVQEVCFRRQMELARQLGLPVIVHEREACRDTMDVIKSFPGVTGVLHCFSGSWETAREALELGWYLSFTGVVTFKNARKAIEVAAKMPLERLMLETDSPYLAPVPNRGKRNSSLNLPFIARRIAEARGMDEAALAEAAAENGRRFFGIVGID